MKFDSTQRVLVTGGAGFLGSHLCERLLEAGNDVLCVDDFYTGTKRSIAHLLNHPRFELLRHDITFPLYLEVDEICNLACPASPIHYQHDPVQTTRTSVHAINVLGLAKRVGAKILQASTSEVYGDPEQRPHKEDYWGRVNLDFALGLSLANAGKRRRLNFRLASWLALTIGALVLDGSIHVAVWCCGVLAPMTLWRWSLAPKTGVALLTGVGLGLGRLLPGALFVTTPSVFISGFPNLGFLLFGLTTIRVPDYNYVIGGRWGALNWWEHDVYIGFAALLILTVMVVVAFRRHSHIRIAPMLAAGAVFFLFSIGDSYWIVRRVVPFIFDSERVSSRFIVIPFVLMLLLAIEGFTLAQRTWPRLTRAGLALSVPITALELVRHFRYRTVPVAERPLRPDIIPRLVLLRPDLTYQLVLLASWAASIALLVVMLMLLLLRRRERDRRPLESPDSTTEVRCRVFAKGVEL
jgi:hypothetical protein